MTYSRNLRVLLVSAALLLSACKSVGVHGHDVPAHGSPDATSTEEHPTPANRTAVIELGEAVDIRALAARIADYPVVLVGETHDRYGDHLGQLDVIKGLAEQGVPIVIGMEMFQQPYQRFLDDYIAGRISEREMLNGTEWFERWRYDYRLYQPILRYAREKGIPVIALNIESEIVERVSSVGIDGLDPAERARLPDLFSGYDETHRERLQKIFTSHAATGKGDFNRFLQVQETWDQGMAKRASDALREYPGRHLVVLAGSGHMMFKAGIPDRLEEYTGAETVVILPGDGLRVKPGIADFIIYPEEAKLPGKGVMGVFLGESEEGVEVTAVVPESAAESAGIEEGDLIQQIDGIALRSPGELKAALMGRAPGESISVKLLRKRLLVEDELIELEFALGE